MFLRRRRRTTDPLWRRFDKPRRAVAFDEKACEDCGQVESDGNPVFVSPATGSRCAECFERAVAQFRQLREEYEREQLQRARPC